MNEMHTPRSNPRNLATAFACAFVALALATPPAVAEGPPPSSADTSRVGCDFNGDGFEDLGIAAQKETTGGVITGSVNVLYGSRDGVTTVGDDYWTPRSAGMPRRIGQFYVSACGDFDADGFDELAVGEIGDDVAVTVLRGGDDGLSTAGSRRMPVAGVELAVGDFNADGADDLLVGSPGADRRRGTVDAYYGAAGRGLLKSSRQRVNQHETETQRDHCGTMVLSGDVNGDGFADAVWSCLKGRDEHDTYGSVVRQALGSPAGLQPAQSRLIQVSSAYDGTIGDFNGDGNADLATGRVRYGSADSGLVDGREQTISVDGSRVGTGDFNGDGIDDLAVGQTAATTANPDLGGTVTVVDGTVDGLNEATAEKWNPARKGVQGTAQRGDQFGWTVTGTDVNGDGSDDLVIGVRLKDLVVKGAVVSNAGATHLLYGSEKGITARGDRFLSQNTRGVRGRAERSDLFGAAFVEHHD